MEICVALGGGGFRGLAHVGVLQVLEEEGYEIVALAGTSIGGIVAAMYAAGSTPQELVTLFAQSSQLGLLRSRPEQGGLIGFDKIETHLASLLGDVRFDELLIPLALTATNLETGHEFVVTEGVVIEAVMASMAVPGIFPPRRQRRGGIDRYSSVFVVCVCHKNNRRLGETTGCTVQKRQLFYHPVPLASSLVRLSAHTNVAHGAPFRSGNTYPGNRPRRVHTRGSERPCRPGSVRKSGAR